MAKFKVKRKVKLGKSFTIGIAFVGIFPSLLILLISFAYMSGVFDFAAPSVHRYEITYKVKEKIYQTQQYIRGEKLIKVDDPSPYFEDDAKFVFIGWDYTGDKIIDILPDRVYASITANAIYSRSIL